MICQICGREAPTKHVVFYQNIGAVVMRFSRTVDGNLCKSCIHQHFWKFTLTNLTLGWWGMISICVTPFFILNNVFRYVFCLGMQPVPVSAVRPELTNEVVDRISPHTDHLIQSLNRQVPLDQVAADISTRARVTPGQVLLYVRALVEHSKQQNQGS